MEAPRTIADVRQEPYNLPPGSVPLKDTCQHLSALACTKFLMFSNPAPTGCHDLRVDTLQVCVECVRHDRPGHSGASARPVGTELR